MDYVAELRGRIPMATLEEKAWPVYRAALLADPGMEDVYAAKVDASGSPVEPAVAELRPGDARWGEAVAALERHWRLVAAAREGGLRPALGFGWLEPTKLSAEDRKALHWTMATAAEFPETIVVWDLTMQVYGRLAEMQHLLVMDSWRAASENDAARLVQNYRAMTGFAAQLRELPLLWNQLLAIQLMDRANQNLGAIEHAYPRLLDGRRVELLHHMAGAKRLFEMEFSGPRMAMMDLVQRTYSDDGHGDGTLTYEGIRTLVERCAWDSGRAAAGAGAGGEGAVCGVVAGGGGEAASRKEIAREMDRVLWGSAAGGGGAVVGAIEGNIGDEADDG